jgi:hypothetical protein
MWQLQDEEPFVLVVDTGSQSAQSFWLLDQLAQDRSIEVARLGILSEVEHRSDRVAIAMDYAFSRCPTEYLLASHVDVFPKHRNLVSKLSAMCNAGSPVVGWEMSPRGPGTEGVRTGTLSNGIPGHACAIFHMPTMDRIGAGWSMRRAHHAFELPRAYTNVHGWPDTEVCLGRILDTHRIRPVFLGRETNMETQETEDWVHARSSTYELLVRGEPLKRQSSAFAQARRRIVEWQLEDSGGKCVREQMSVNGKDEISARRVGNGAFFGLPDCHSRRELSGDKATCFCAHPRVHVRDCLVTREICALCSYWKDAAPERFRPFVPTHIGGAESGPLPTTVGVVIYSAGDQASLRDSLDSAVTQSFRAQEIVVLVSQPASMVEELLNAYPSDLVRPHPIEGLANYDLRAAFAATRSQVICVLNEGDILSPRFLEWGMQQFQEPDVAVVYADIETFGHSHELVVASDPLEAWQKDHRDIGAGDLIRRMAFESCALRHESAHPFGGVDPELSKGNNEETAFPGLLDTSWNSRKQRGIYHKRVRNAGEFPADRQGRPTDGSHSHVTSAITLFIPLAGRFAHWPGLAQFLEEQTYPHELIQLYLLDTSQDGQFARMARSWAANCDYADVRYVARAVGQSRLADRARLEVAHQVAAATARIYNSLRSAVCTEFVWIVEDDVLPPLDACTRLLEHFDLETASASGAYRSRFGGSYVAWGADGRKYIVAGSGVHEVAGNGLGCVVLRTGILRKLSFSPTPANAASDSAFYARLRQLGLKAKIDWSVVCDHRIVVAGLPTAPLPATEGLSQRPDDPPFLCGAEIGGPTP